MLYAKEQKVFTIEEIVNNLFTTEERSKVVAALQWLNKKGKLYRYERGIYGYETYIPLFDISSHLGIEEAFTRLYLRNDEGYISGADFAYMIGLSTWCAAKRLIVSNKVSRKKQKNNLYILPPKTTITKHNKPYLQLLDCIAMLDKLPVDAHAPYQIITRYIEKKGMDVKELIAFAKEFYNIKILECFWSETPFAENLRTEFGNSSKKGAVT